MCISYIIANESLFNCITNCTLECQSSYYPSTLSFSQLSSQAESSLLSKKGDAISKEYLDASQLFYRLDFDSTFLNTLGSSYEPIEIILNVLDIIFPISLTFMDAVQMYNNVFIKASLYKLQQYFNSFIVAYNSNYKEIRQLASDYVSEAAFELYDLDKRMQLAPTAFEKPNDAQLFLTGMLLLFDKCMLSTNAAIAYLSQAVKDEINLHTNSSTKSFYANETYSLFCNNTYSSTLQTLENIINIISFARQKVLLFLAANNDLFSEAAVNTFSIIITNQSLNDNDTSFIPGLWTLFQCMNCSDGGHWPSLNYSTWMNFKSNINSNVAVVITQCMLHYEQALSDAYKSTFQFVETTPDWSLIAMVDFNKQALKRSGAIFNSISHSYILGSVNLQATIQGIESVLENVTASVQNIATIFSSSVINWNRDVVIWQNNFIALFQSVFRSTTVFSQFMPNTKGLASTFSSLAMWTASSMKLGSYYSYSTTNPSYIDVLQRVNNILINYTSEATTALLTDIAELAYGYNIGYTLNMDKYITKQSNQWMELSENLTEFMTAYQKRFIIGGEFIR